jgi:hypothetical protein
MSFTWLAGVDLICPVVLTVVAYLALLLWCITRPRQLILRGAPDRSRWRDLRLWILPLILVQIALHWWFR